MLIYLKYDVNEPNSLLTKAVICPMQALPPNDIPFKTQMNWITRPQHMWQGVAVVIYSFAADTKTQAHLEQCSHYYNNCNCKISVNSFGNLTAW